MLDREQLQTFAKDGYLIIDGFFNETEIADFRESTRRVIRAVIERAKREHPDRSISVPDGEEFDHGTQVLNVVDHDYIAQIYDTICFTPAFFRIAGKRESAQVVNQLLQRDLDAPLFGFKNRCRIEPPLDDRRFSGWHQQVFSGVPEAGEFIQTWAPLIHHSTRANGTLLVAAGSHEAGIPKQHWIDGTEDKVVQVIVDGEIVERYEHRSMEMSVGQLLVFTGKTIHCSGTNVSKQTRYSLVGEYYSVDDPNLVPPKPSKNFRRLGARAYYDKISATWAVEQPSSSLGIDAKYPRV